MTDSELTVIVSNNMSDIVALVDEGFTPIECSIGGKSIVDDLEMDHHGKLSDLEGVAIRAYRDHFGARKDDPRFVIAGAADADATFAIASLLGILPHPNKEALFAEGGPLHDLPYLRMTYCQNLEGLASTINKIDTDPIGLDKTTMQGGDILLAWHALTMHQGSDSLGGIGATILWKFLTTNNPSLNPLFEGALHTERSRLEEARKAMADDNTSIVIGLGRNTVRAISSDRWGFDAWYDRERSVSDPGLVEAWNAPVVVWFKPRAKRLDVGCPNVEVAESLFGPGGLKNVFPVLDKEVSLGEGWGGRESIGGGPRDVAVDWVHARETANAIRAILTQ